MKPDSCFVNIGRGAVVDERALETIAKEKLIQIALDVYEVEPLPKDSPLRGLENVTLMPHLGGPTVDYRKECGRFALENIKRYLNHNPIESLVSEAIYDRST